MYNSHVQIYLAGFNVDAEVISELTKGKERSDVTPETLSAAYARISRDPRPVDELRKIARQEVEKARKSNSNIIFKMGHHSVAEHAVFNFDLIGVSRRRPPKWYNHSGFGTTRGRRGEPHAIGSAPAGLREPSG